MSQSPAWPFSAGDCPGPVMTRPGAWSPCCSPHLAATRSYDCGRAWSDSAGSPAFTGWWRASLPPEARKVR